MKIAVLFPGQGSQYIGMGQGFITSDSECAAILEKAESVCDFPLGKICQEGPMEELTRAVHLQPAITVTNLVCWQAVQKAFGKKQTVSCFAGHSLGEYSALYAAGVLSLGDTIRLVVKRGALMEREGRKNPGGMRAVLGLGIEEMETILSRYNGPGIVTAANHNTEKQVVISGEEYAMDMIGIKVAEQGGKVVPLNVSIANHSPLVADAVPDFAEFMREVEFNEPRSPIFFNVTASVEKDVNTIKEIMARQIASKVRWYELINGMIETGVDTFIEVGPKTVLKGLMKKIVPKGYAYTAMQVDSPDTLAKCMEKLQSE
jgi:[acyl-carrier-protein] S-malonyltransferase